MDVAKIRKIIAGIGLCLITHVASAEADLLAVYFQALKYDPSFQNAFASKLATEEAYPQARAAFLPTISATASHTHRSQFLDRYNTHNSNILGIAFQGNFRYHQKYYQIALSESLINYTNWKNLQLADATVKQAVATYNASLQDLMVRVTNAYLNVLQAEDTLRFTKAEKRANFRQLEQAQHRYQVGLDAVTAVYDAQASFDAVKAQEISAQNDAINARESLREITGVYYETISKLKGDLPLLKPDPSDPKEWSNTAIKRNFTLLATEHSKQAAYYNVGAKFGGHLPSLAVTGQLDGTRGGTAGQAGTSQRDKIMALQLTLPIFAGGYVDSEVRQARYQFQAAKAELERVKRSVVSQTHQSYNSVIAGISRIVAGRQAVKSASSSVESTEAAFKVGTRTMVNVLDAQKDLYDAERALAKTQYDYIRSILGLKQAAGTLNISDIEEINTWLASTTAETTMERFKFKGLLPHSGTVVNRDPMRVFHRLVYQSTCPIDEHTQVNPTQPEASAASNLNAPLAEQAANASAATTNASNQAENASPQAAETSEWASRIKSLFTLPQGVFSKETTLAEAEPTQAPRQSTHTFESVGKQIKAVLPNFKRQASAEAENPTPGTESLANTEKKPDNAQAANQTTPASHPTLAKTVADMKHVGTEFKNALSHLGKLLSKQPANVSLIGEDATASHSEQKHEDSKALHAAAKKRAAAPAKRKVAKARTKTTKHVQKASAAKKLKHGNKTHARVARHQRHQATGAHKKIAHHGQLQKAKKLSAHRRLAQATPSHPQHSKTSKHKS